MNLSHSVRPSSEGSVYSALTATATPACCKTGWALYWDWAEATAITTSVSNSNTLSRLIPAPWPIAAILPAAKR